MLASPRPPAARDLILVTFGLLVGCCPPPGPVEPPGIPDVQSRSPSDQYWHAADSLVRIETVTGIATGIVVRNDGLVALPRAPLRGVGAARVLTSGGRTLAVQRVLPTGDLELALVAVEVHVERLPSLQLAPDPAPEIGETVAVVGFATGATFPSLSVAVVSEMPSLRAPWRFAIRGPLPGGFSGAPVLNAQGDVLGLVENVEAAGATVLTTAALAAELVALDVTDGEPIAAYGARTRDSEIIGRVVTVQDLADCSPASLDLIWNDLEHGLGAAEQVSAAGESLAALLVLEGALLRHRSELTDCRRLYAAVDQALTTAHDAPSVEGATRAATQTTVTTLEAILTASSVSPKAVAAQRPTAEDARRPSKP